MGKLDLVKSKIFTWPEMKKRCAMWHLLGKKIVFTNGCFDILHLGHIEYLSKAAGMGDALVIGLNSDESVRKLKGDHRPINNENARAMVLASLRFTDAVVVFNEDNPYELIRLIQPDILVKGNDYKTEEIAGHDIVLSQGGKVITIELTPGYSTTGIAEKISQSIKK
jgi:rfaE bifunctional protein nucleotidyltransferase chain/domain